MNNNTIFDDAIWSNVILQNITNQTSHTLVDKQITVSAVALLWYLK